jgi:hypothetical protein
MTILQYQQQQHKTIWPYYIISSNNTKPYDHPNSSNTKPYDHSTIPTAATQNLVTILHYQQQQHKIIWTCYTINSNNTNPYEHVTLWTAAATSGYKPYVSCPFFTSFVLNIFSLTALHFLCQMDRYYTRNVKLMSYWVSIISMSTYVCSLNSFVLTVYIWLLPYVFTFYCHRTGLTAFISVS